MNIGRSYEISDKDRFIFPFTHMLSAVTWARWGGGVKTLENRHRLNPLPLLKMLERRKVRQFSETKPFAVLSFHNILHCGFTFFVTVQGKVHLKQVELIVYVNGEKASILQSV